jgi:hypothetical protein
MAPLLILLAAIVGAGGVIWLIGAREPVYAIRSGSPTWFVALRTEAPPEGCLASGVKMLWRAQSDFTLIGAEDAYWTHFMIVAGETATPLSGDAVCEDAYVARVRLFAPPRLALGVLRMLTRLGLLSRPAGEIAQDASALGFRGDLMPSAAAIATLLGRPPTYAPAMVNFLDYHDSAADGSGESGWAAYRRYGRAALRAVYRTGGALLFYGAVTEIERAAKAGPTLGSWDEVAAMRYPNPSAILSMEQLPFYRAALAHRDAGLARTVVIATHEG